MQILCLNDCSYKKFSGKGFKLIMKWEIITICFIFFTASFLIGHFVNCLCRLKDQTIFLNLFTGTITIWGLLELILVPMTFSKIPFHTLSHTYGVLLIAGCIASFFFFKKMKQVFFDFSKNWKSYISWTILIAILIIFCQLYYIHHYTYYEWDDAFYVNIANEALQNDIIFGIEPEGGNGPYFSWRYALSLWPIFYALLSNWFQIHPAIIAHTILPFIIIPFAYLVYFLMGQLLFSKDKELQGYFLILSTVVHMFLPNIHIFGGSYLLLAPWMGKAILASISLPAVLYLMLRLTKDPNIIGNWMLLFLHALNSCMHSPMGILFVPVFAGSLGILWALKIKNIQFFLKTVLCCTPCLVLGVFYLLNT